MCYTEIDITGEIPPPSEREEKYARGDATDLEVDLQIPCAVRNF